MFICTLHCVARKKMRIDLWQFNHTLQSGTPSMGAAKPAMSTSAVWRAVFHRFHRFTPFPPSRRFLQFSFFRSRKNFRRTNCQLQIGHRMQDEFGQLLGFCIAGRSFTLEEPLWARINKKLCSSPARIAGLGWKRRGSWRGGVFMWSLGRGSGQRQAGGRRNSGRWRSGNVSGTRRQQFG